MKGKRYLVVALMVALVIAPCALGQWSRDDDNSLVINKKLWNSLMLELSGEIARHHVERISQFHRIRGGSPEYYAAVEYVKTKIAEYGLQEIEVERFLADGFATYLTWRSPVGWKVRDAELWMTEPDRDLLARYSDVAVSLMSYSNGGKAAGELIDVGSGISDKDYEGKDVKGKFVLANGYGGSVHRQAVIKRGALGVVCYPSGREERKAYPDLIEMARLSPTGEERSKTTFGFSISQRQADRIKTFMNQGKKVKLDAWVDAELIDGEMPVLTACIKGSKYPEQEIILMAHLDHYRPGANDNASGSAALMEMARTIKALIKRGEISAPLRTIKFMWVPEYHGTMAYLSRHPEISEKALVGINMDMVGENLYLCKSMLTLNFPPLSEPSYIGDLMVQMIELVDRSSVSTPRGSHQAFNYRIRPYSGGSDHEPFNDTSIGVPSVMMGHPDIFHHSSMDTLDKVDQTELKRSSLAALGATLFMANAEEKDACKLAFFLSAKAQARLDLLTANSLQSLWKSLNENDAAEALYKNYKEALSANNFATQCEIDSIEACFDFDSSAITKKVIAQLFSSMQKYHDLQKEKIDSCYDLICSINKFRKQTVTLTEEEEKAKEIIPVRKFRGMLSDSFLEENLNPEKLKWYEEYGQKDGQLQNKLFEIVNFINGKRSMLDIRNAISTEFGPTDLELVRHYLSDLKELNFVSY
jgi:aminopeptidase YwaD